MRLVQVVSVFLAIFYSETWVEQQLWLPNANSMAGRSLEEALHLVCYLSTQPEAQGKQSSTHNHTALSFHV